jgi:hypothetical protein
MSRSRRNRPIAPVTLAQTEKEWKQHSARRHRRAETVALAKTAPGDDPDLPSKRSLDHYGPKEGKLPFDPADWPEGMRK